MASTIVQFECRSPDHMRIGDRLGIGGLVIHHGSVGFCHAVNVDGAHQWVPTGGVPVDDLFDPTRRFDGPGTYRAGEGALIHVRPSLDGRLRVEVDRDGSGSRGDLHVGAKLSDDPDWPSPAPLRLGLLSAD